MRRTAYEVWTTFFEQIFNTWLQSHWKLEETIQGNGLGDKSIFPEIYVCDSSFLWVRYFKRSRMQIPYSRKFKLNGKRVALYVFIVSSLNILMYFSKIFIACDSSLAEIGRQHEWVTSSNSDVLLKVEIKHFTQVCATCMDCQFEKLWILFFISCALSVLWVIEYE